MQCKECEHRAMCQDAIRNGLCPDILHNDVEPKAIVLMRSKTMYYIIATVMFDDGTQEIKEFDLWGDAAQWIIDLANERESLPFAITMTKESN